ncbi:hypothetical protein BHE74_00050713 [Ensete ventricosum]|nr:hypothetical protein GW17_00032143 [Ensete ventricosum]RWW43613.1 hypothetical protein BHE74_00050713 [Ensete ventricosum]
MFVWCQGLFVGVAGSANGAISSGNGLFVSSLSSFRRWFLVDLIVSSCAGHNRSFRAAGTAMFDVEYARWLDENCKHMSDLRGALQAHLPDGNLGVIVDQCIANYDELFRLKQIVGKSDVFHLLNGAWMTPAERCFLWMGGFRPSELLEIVMPQLDPLTEQQLLVIGNLRLSSRQAEEALSLGLDQLHRSLADTVTRDSLSDGVDVGNYMGHMAVALENLANLEGFVRQVSTSHSL